MRGSAVHFALDRSTELEGPFDLILASSFTPLAELVGLVPSLAPVPRILYFHENQLRYPNRSHLERDLHYGFTQLTSALAASLCAFNSRFNRDSFLVEARGLLARMPDAVPGRWIERIEEKTRILPVPIDLPEIDPTPDPPAGTDRAGGPTLLWNHRWEHDKGPEVFFGVLESLADRGVPFRLAVCGESFDQVPEAFHRAREKLADRIVHWGHLPTRTDYVDLLSRAHVVVSCAHQEFFGISMLEATHHGARPVVPDSLVYPEIYPSEYRYRSESDLAAMLEDLARSWTAGEIDLRSDRTELTKPFSPRSVLPAYVSLFEELIGPRPPPPASDG